LPNELRIKRYFKLGCEVKGMGRGHINWIKAAAKKEAVTCPAPIKNKLRGEVAG
jgi:hypothetical protein